MKELDDRWILAFRGLKVTQVLVDLVFGLNLSDEGAAVRIGGVATLGRVNRSVEPVVLNPSTAGRAAGLVLFGTEVLSAVAFKSGSLRMVLGTGHVLTVKADEQYEAWRVTGPDGSLIVSQPGGGLAVFS